MAKPYTLNAVGRSAVSLKDAWRHVERSRWKNLREAPREEGD
eukprot:CAMPEP_0180225200 /NCGR_PEP_ID=MMETSP0987-20121128/22563_1 /TAXON_ID=697907 /ORGANISM="non described non described, Strain CCMP2293" /LENGTH=41 /DNA_ID= /DNA_START= /DNA_END= /DNA_ORIENTATION=